MTEGRVNFAVAMKRYFGLKEGQKLAGFAAELNALSFEEKMEFATALRSVGIDCEDPKSKSN